MSDNALKACMLGLMGVTMAVLGGCVIAGHDSVITDSMLVMVGAVSGLGIWERLKR